MVKGEDVEVVATDDIREKEVVELDLERAIALTKMASRFAENVLNGIQKGNRNPVGTDFGLKMIAKLEKAIESVYDSFVEFDDENILIDGNPDVVEKV